MSDLTKVLAFLIDGVVDEPQPILVRQPKKKKTKKAIAAAYATERLAEINEALASSRLSFFRRIDLEGEKERLERKLGLR